MALRCSFHKKILYLGDISNFEVCECNVFFSQVVTLQAQLESLKVQASQGYTNEFFMSGTQQDNIYVNKFMDYQQEEGGMPHPVESCTSVKNESQQYLGSNIMTCTSMQSHQLHNPHQYRSDSTSSFNTDSDPSCTMFYLNLQEDVQKNGYYCTDDLQQWHLPI